MNVKEVIKFFRPLLSKVRTIILIVLSLFLFTRSIYLSDATTLSEEKSTERINLAIKEMEWNEAYEKIVDTLKYHEGYRGYPYYCLASVLTVGYGHALKRGDNFSYPLSEFQADSLLRVDLDASIVYVQKTTELEHIQLLAIAHFVYALGSGNFQNSALKQRIMANESIDSEIVKWIHIRTKNGIIKSEWLRASRRMELELYNSST